MRYYMLNKPLGQISAVFDANRPTVMDNFPDEIRLGLSPVGRLDADTSGLLIITDDGLLNHRLTSPDFCVEKEYFFMAFGEISPEKLEELKTGTTLPGNGFHTSPARLEIIDTTTVANVEQHLPDKIHDSVMKNPKGAVTIGRMWLTQGHKHQVRLMLKSAGCHVFVLRRDSVGGVRLDPTLKPGEFRELSKEELDLFSVYSLLLNDQK